MNELKVTALDYINFLVAAPRVVSCVEAARVQPEGTRRAAHDAFNRLLHRLEPDPTPIWRETEKRIRTLGSTWLTRLKADRLITPDGSGNRRLADCASQNGGTRVYLKGSGCILVFRFDTLDGDTAY